MHRRRIRRAAVLALAAALASASAVSADGLFGDGDTVAAGRQTSVQLGGVAPGATITVDVRFELVCSGTSHPDAGQAIELTPMTPTLPPGSAVVTVPSAAVGPVPAGWPVDGAACPVPAPVLSSEPVSVSFTAPTTINSGYAATFPWRRTITPAGVDDATALTGTATAVSFFFDVVADTPPTLTVPGDLVVEADTLGGWTADISATATDAEDDPDPAATCEPANGAILPLGTTTVTCSATDTAGQTTTASFSVTVIDSTAPTIGAVADVEATTSDAGGRTVTYPLPAAADIADPAPVVGCDPASGSHFPVGTTTVTCTATDASGNAASTSFAVTVRHLPASSATATWLDPLGIEDGATFRTNAGRTLPVKVVLRVDGEIRTTGTAALTLTPCAGGPAETVPLAPGPGRWQTGLDTGSLVAACYRVTTVIDGLDAGGFTLELRGSEATSRKALRH